MIDPINMTRYGLSHVELEETLLFSCCVAGKNAVTTARLLDNFLVAGHRIIYQDKWQGYKPFEMLRELYDLIGRKRVAGLLRDYGIGCYNNRSRTFQEVIEAKFNLQTVTVEELEAIWGIAEKTSRFFVLHTRPNVRYAALDTHIRKHMESKGILFPNGQPKGKKYLELEQKFLQLADESGMTVAEFDLYLWNFYRGKNEKVLV